MRDSGWKFVRELYRAPECDVDRENCQAYEKYFVHYPWHLGSYEHYTPEKAAMALESHMERLTIKDLPNFGLCKDDLADKVIWDLGSSVGNISMCFAKNFGAKEVHAIDQSENAIKWGRHLSQLNTIDNVFYHQCNLYELSQLSEVVNPDIIHCAGVTHHMYDLKRLAMSIASQCRVGTRLYFTHSSYKSRKGLLKYFYNHLCWARGGTDLEKRMEAGKSIWERWINFKEVPDEVIKNHLADLAGALYIARRKKTIMDAFEGCGFVFQGVSSLKAEYPFSVNSIKNWKRFVRYTLVGQLFFDLPPSYFRAVYSPNE